VEYILSFSSELGQFVAVMKVTSIPPILGAFLLTASDKIRNEPE
jgi:hypothetical protein